jgi:MoaA/NifB/PqqE/SkfB family radical SAM enzyme
MINGINFLKLCRWLVSGNTPIYVHFGITHHCNLSCRMCMVRDNTSNSRELSTTDIKNIFLYLKKQGIIYVSISGGEPFLREDLCQVIGFLRKQGFMVRLLTNGTLCTRQNIRELAAVGLREVSVSLDTMHPGLQDRICNKPGTHEKIISSLELFSEIIPRSNRLLMVNTVVSPLNISELPALSRAVKGLGYCISFIPLEENGDNEFRFSPDDYSSIDAIYNELINMKRKFGTNIFNTSYFLEMSRRFLKRTLVSWGCDAGRQFFSLSPEGGLCACHKYPPFLFPAEQGRDSRMLDVKLMRTNVSKPCTGCLRPCWAETSFVRRRIRSLWEVLWIQIKTRNPLCN